MGLSNHLMLSSSNRNLVKILLWWRLAWTIFSEHPLTLFKCPGWEDKLPPSCIFIFIDLQGWLHFWFALKREICQCILNVPVCIYLVRHFSRSVISWNLDILIISWFVIEIDLHLLTVKLLPSIFFWILQEIADLSF